MINDNDDDGDDDDDDVTIEEVVCWALEDRGQPGKWRVAPL